MTTKRKTALKNKIKVRKWGWDKKKPTRNDLFWHYDYRHYLRDVGEERRTKILKEFVIQKLNPEGKSKKHLKIIKNILK